MDRETYRQNLIALSQARVENPTIDDIAKISPHLSRQEIAEMIEEMKKKKKGYYNFFTPHCLIPGATHSLLLERKGGLRYGYCEGAHALVRLMNNHQHRAADWLWSDTPPVIDKWQDAVTIYITRWPKHVSSLTIFTDRPWENILNDRRAPSSELIDASIVFINSYRPEREEILGAHNGGVLHNCGACGTGLPHLHEQCAGCGSESTIFCEGRGETLPMKPLAPKICEHLIEHGHVFQIDPAIAREHERRLWEATQK
ncbi:MAG: hypothetical protein KBC95_01075 [Candidatus Peribacteraceae bacterium]|nr:hypothetical protein [Candidatus Peribacteraceae bacterium]